ncbi:MAG: pyridoxamine 5'-phosphate oxidase [Deltaproteobacteria bacterium]|nr:MAG: pyridoxamine 5'-phosphate oxidase [Deltaproteobacteria bacterium]
MDLRDYRREYLVGGLSRKDLADDPVVQFTDWFETAQKNDIPDSTAMVLATVNDQGQPNQRTVLLKYYDHSGFVFFTNYSSRKASDMKGNQRVSLLFVWLELERQVAVHGLAEKISALESAKYFMSRPKESQMAAWVSSQSHPIRSRQLLMQKFQEIKTKIGQGDVPIPSFWGGYRVVPYDIEFWQGRENRLHDRFLYSRGGDNVWTIERLAP